MLDSVLQLTDVVPHARLLVAALAAALVVALTARGAWAGTGRWSALAVLGSAASLSLIQAGPTVRYQHYVDWARLPDTPWAVAALVLQALLVGAGWQRGGNWTRVRVGIRDAFGWWRLVVFVATLWLLGATIARDVPMYAREMVTAGVIGLLQLATLGLAALAAPEHDAVPTGDDTGGRALGRLEWSAAALVALTCVTLNQFVYERHPHVPDEVAYLFHARYLAQGVLAIDTPPVHRAFETYLTTASPQGWYSVVAPGWPAVLAMGAAVGAEHWVNPLLSGVNVLLVALLLHAWYGRRTRQTGVVLMAASPWQIFLGMSYMPQTTTLTLALLAALGVERARRTGRSGPAWAAGAALGVLAIVRQLDALIAAVVLGLWAVGVGGRRIRTGATAGLVFGALAVAAILLPYNAHFTGAGARFPVMAYLDQRYAPGANDYGFGANRGMGWALDPRPGHDIVDGLINTDLNLTATQVELFGWGAGSLGFAIFLLLATRLDARDRAMLGVIAIVVAAYFANYFSGGPDFGARYWYLAFPPLLALSARGIEAFDALTGVRRRMGTVMAAVATMVAIVTFMPWRATDKYFHYRGMRPDVRQLALDRSFGASLVVINGESHPDYASASTYNPLEWNAPVPLYALNVDADVIPELRAAYPDRPLWVLDGPTITGEGYRVVAGPIPPGAPVTIPEVVR